MKITSTHVFFYGDFLSNWAEAPFTIDWVNYHSSEHYFMAKKASFFGDYDTFAKILDTDNPKEAKALGRLVREFNPGTWSNVSQQIMYKGCFEKFKQNPGLRQQLLNFTLRHKTLVEASPYDKIWGIGLGLDNENIFDESLWQGHNLLGKVLNRVRYDLLDLGY